MIEFQVHQQQLNKTQLVENNNAIRLKPGEVKLRIDAFSFTANNITYWAMGDKLGYWQFFPVSENTSSEWGIIPAWGFADVVASNNDQVTVGERLFGYFPTASEWVMQPTKVSRTLWFDGSAHRAELPMGYNMYRRVHTEPDYQTEQDALRMLLFPLHITSFCIHDMLKSKNFMGAKQILILSASSKTSLGLAYAIQHDPSAPTAVGLTSGKNKSFVQQTMLYSNTLAYDELDLLDCSLETIIVDMSGNGKLIAQLHKKLNEKMLFSSHVGLTHWDETDPEPGFIAERSKMFFAPSHIQQRYLDWGAEKFELLANEFMQKAAIDSARWLQIHTVKGLTGLQQQFEAVSQGELPANRGLIIKLGD